MTPNLLKATSRQYCRRVRRLEPGHTSNSVLPNDSTACARQSSIVTNASFFGFGGSEESATDHQSRKGNDIVQQTGHVAAWMISLQTPSDPVDYDNVFGEPGESVDDDDDHVIGDGDDDDDNNNNNNNIQLASTRLSLTNAVVAENEFNSYDSHKTARPSVVMELETRGTTSNTDTEVLPGQSEYTFDNSTDDTLTV